MNSTGMMDLNLSGKTAMVGGSTQGIGKASAIQLSKQGANIILMARNMESLKKVREELDTSVGQKHQYLCVDYLEEESFRNLVEEFMKKSPPVHILVNNTGGPAPGPAENADIESFRNAFSQHLICNHILTKHVQKDMEAAGYGRIINIISTSVKQPIPNLGVSNTVRGAVANWSKTLSLELAGRGITVNNILPGATYTSRLENLIRKKSEATGKDFGEIRKELEAEIPARRFADPMETAMAVGFLASPSASYINGVNLPVDGGRTACL